MTGSAMSLDGKRVVVIGGTSGIGFAVAELARAQGAAVVIASRDRANVDAAVERLQGATGRTVDLRDEAIVAGFFAELGPFDHLALTAGDWDLPMIAPTRELDLALAREFFAVRFWGVLAAVKHGCRAIAPGGSITMTSGVLSQRPRKGAPMATVIGGAVEHLTRGLAVDLAPVRVNCVCPGLVLTEHVKHIPEARLQAMVASLPLPRAASPAEAATAYVYSMLNSYLTGQILPVDGGGLLT
jgi:NAD(P)-dependent dehydrogenase (short-subunit alcohol dehydrogenase family)